MSLNEKLFSVVAVCYIAGLAATLILYPASRSLAILLPFSLLGITLNAGLLFVVFKDIFSRTFNKAYSRYLWAFLIFFFIPTILVYLPKYGFKKK